ncbi:MAG: RDD family protein [Lentisphaerae bacterium]|nr:RDD family protein [Lentisphaerota bacterium]
MQWYYAENGETSGPLDEQAFADLVSAGNVRDDTLVWHDGMEEWQPYGLLADATGVRCSVCGRPFAEDELIRFQGSLICAACKPEFFQRVKEGASLPGVMNFASFGLRAGAKIIDWIILSSVSMLLSFVVGAISVATAEGSPEIAFAIQMVLMVIQTAIGIAYTVFFLGRFGATPGKMACKIKVVRSDGSPITYGRAFSRYWGELLSGIILYIGYFMAAFDDEKRTLHDRICDTRVITSGK